MNFSAADFIYKIKNFECPILDIMNRKGWTSYIDFIKEKELGQNSVMKGIDCIGRPFIAIKAEYVYPNNNNNVEEETVPTFSTFFQRYTDDSNTWQCCGHDGTLLFATEGGMRKEQFETLVKLLYETKVDLDPELIKKNRFIVYDKKKLNNEEEEESTFPLQIRLRKHEILKSYHLETNDF